jgi:hypothetical protein
MADAESRTPSVDDLDLDFTKLSAATVADRGELWLLQWLGRLETALAVLDEVWRRFFWLFTDAL